EAALRENLVRSDRLEAVIGLGPGLFYNSPMEAVVVTLRARKSTEQRGKVLFINAVDEVAREHAQSFLRGRHQQRILSAYEGFTDEEGFATVVTLDQIAEKRYSLAIPLYVTRTAPADDAGAVEVNEAVAAWRTAAEVAETSVDAVLT